MFAALGHTLRLRLLREILGGRRTATELAGLDEVGTSGQIYHHLRQLTAAGWLRQAGRGRYEIPAGRVVPLLVALATARSAGPDDLDFRPSTTSRPTTFTTSGSLGERCPSARPR